MLFFKIAIVLLLCLLMAISYILYLTEGKRKNLLAKYDRLKQDKIVADEKELAKLIIKKKNLEEELKSLKEKQDNLTLMYKQYQDNYNQLLQNQDKQLKETFALKEAAAANKLEEENKNKIEEYNKEFDKLKSEQLLELSRINIAIEDAKIALSEFSDKQKAINDAILREKEKQENTEFFSINVPEQDKSDITLLLNFEKNFYNKEAIRKLIYDCFLKTPLLEMEKRVLGGTPSGIYKITYLPTGESYIGKSTNVYKRFQEHIKSSLNIGTIAHTTFHNKLYELGWWNFSFELLEKVEKERLGEREKFYISLYETDKCGFNMKAGG